MQKTESLYSLLKNEIKRMHCRILNISLSYFISLGLILIGALTTTCQSQSALYWIGDGGNWTDASHWSDASGGLANASIPTQNDTVIFDANSFSLTAQTVLVDDTAFFSKMDWTGVFGNQSLSLDSNIYSYGDVILHPNLTINRNIITAGIVFKAQSELSPNACTMDCSFLILMDSASDSLLLINDLIMSDTSSVIIFNGELYTQDNSLKTGSLLSVEINPLDSRKIDFGNSFIELILEFNTAADDQLTFVAGGSHLYIGDTISYFPDTISYGNALKTQDLSFYDVTLNFQPINSHQLVTGNNTFNKLSVVPGSRVHLQQGSTQTVADSLILNGNCQDMITIASSDTTATLNTAGIIKQNSNLDFIGQGLNLQQIDASGGLMLTTYHSLDNTGNVNWDFSSVSSVTSAFSVNGPFCFGDTTILTNNSSILSGLPNDMSSIWYFNDNSTGYYLNPPVDSTWITYVSDTNQHVFQGSGNFNVTIVTTNTVNHCTDTLTQVVHINNPTVYLSTSEQDTTICIGDEVIFEAQSPISGVQFEYFYNGLSQNTPSVNDTLFVTSSLSDLDTLSVLAYENGCVSDTMPQYIFVVHDLPVYTFVSDDIDSSICAGDNVLFTASSVDLSFDYHFLVDGIGVTPITDTIGYYNTSSIADNNIISTVVVDDNGCTDTTSMTFNVNPLPLVSLSESTGGNVICGNDAVTFTGTGASQYDFFINGISVQGPSNNSSYINSSLNATDTISLNGFSAFGCIQNALETFTYIVNPAPTTDISSSDSDNTICSNEQVEFTASGAVFYEFFIDGGSVQGPGSNNVYLASGLNDNEVVSVLGILGGCNQMSSNMEMTVFQAPSTSLSNDDDGDNTICSGTSVEFTASGAQNYEFFIDGISQGPSSSQNTFTTSDLQNNQSITVAGESNSCIINALQTFTVLVNPVVDIFSNDIDNILCDQDPITVTGVNASSYAFWVNGTLFQALSSNNVLNNPALPIGVDTILVQGFSANGCDDFSPPLIVTVNAIPNIVVTSSDLDNEICQGDSIDFIASGGDSYQYFLNGVPQGPVSSDTEFSTASINDGESVLVQGSLLGCSSTSNSFLFNVIPVPNVSVQSSDVDNIFCMGDEVIFTANGADNYEFFVDGISQGTPSANNQISSVSFNAGIYDLVVNGESLGCTDQEPVSLIINPLPPIDLVSSDPDNSICSGQNVIFVASGGSTYLFYIDNTPQGVVSFTNQFSTQGLLNGNNVSVVAITSQGCIDSMSTGPITVNATPTITLTTSINSPYICSGDNVDFSASGSPEFEYFIDGFSYGSTSNPLLSIDSLSNGESIYVIGTSTEGCTNTSNVISYNVYPIPNVSLINYDNSQLCVGENTNLEAFGANLYQFSVNGIITGNFDANSIFSSSLNNNDIVSVIGESNGCQSSNTSEIQFTVFQYPTLVSSSSDNDNVVCAQDTVIITASGGQYFNFIINGEIMQSGTQNTYEAYLLSQGDVLEVITLNGDCPSSPDSYVFFVNEMDLNLSLAESSMVCEGESVGFSAEGGDEYQFLVNGIEQGPFNSSNLFDNLIPNDFDEISFNAYNASTGCYQKYNDYILMHVQNTPLIDPEGNISICEGDSLLLVSNYNYGNHWFLDGDSIVGANDTIYYATEAGSYSFTGTHGGLGNVWSIGQNASGILGNGTNFNSSNPQMATNSISISSIYTGTNFIVAINDLNQVFAWGENNTGQLGNGTFTSSNIPMQTPGLPSIKSCATSESSTMALATDGSVYVWGGNTEGELGIGSTSVVNFPLVHPTLTDIDSIVSGLNHFLILKNDSTVWSVGNNDYGQLGIGSNSNTNTPVLITSISNIVQIGAGEQHSFAIDSSGMIYVWGNNSSGQLGTGDLNIRLLPDSINLTKIVAVEGGSTHSLFLNDKGDVYSCGDSSFGQLGNNLPGISLTPDKIEISGVNQISAGKYTSLFKRKDNSVFGCGRNLENQIFTSPLPEYSTPTHLNNVHGVGYIEASATSSHFIYSESNSCISNILSLNVLTIPDALISINSDTLEASPGDTYQWYLDGNIIPNANEQIYVPEISGNYSVEVGLNNGCSSFSESYAIGINSLSDFTSNQILVYPNPAHNVLFIGNNSASKNLEIVIRDQIGKTVYQSKLSIQEVLSIDIESLKTGNYFISIRRDAQFSYFRFTKIN